MRSLAALAFACLVPAGFAHAVDYYVSTSGSNANTGTIASPWRTVTHAVANAPSGSRIVVAAGTYGTAPHLEGIELSGGKQLKIVGAGMGQTTIRTHVGFAPTIPYRNTTRTWTAVVAAHGVGTTLDIRNLTLDADHLSSAALLSCAVYTDGAQGRLVSVEMRGAGAVTPDGAQGHVAFVACGKDTLNPSLIQIDRCHLHGWNKAGLLLTGLGLSADVVGCEIVGAGPLDNGAAAQNAVQIEEGNNYLLKNNLIRDVWYVPTSFNSLGILVYDTFGTVELRANRVFNSKQAIYYYAPTGLGATVEGNLVGNCAWALSADSSGVSAKHNRFDSHYGVYAKGTTVITLQDNLYSDWRSNPGWPTRYIAGGNTSVQDLSPRPHCPSFQPPVSIPQPAGAGPNDIVVADFDADGKLDFATTHQLSNFVRIYFGSGGALFTIRPPKDIPIPGGPVFLCTGEFSGNPGVDLAVVSTDGNVRVLSNIANTGNFNVSPPFDIDGAANDKQPTRMVAGSLDYANEDEIVIAYAGDGLNNDGGIVILSTNNAVMTLASANPLPGTLRSIQGVAIGDVDGDNRNDLVATDSGNLNGNNDAVFVWRQSATTGIFSAPQQLPLAGPGRGVALGDLDADGDLDVVASTFGDPSTVHVFEGDGAGSFAESPASPWLVAGGAGRLAIADIANDGDFDTERVDVLLAHPLGSRISLLEAYDGETFSSFSGCATGLDPRAFALAKLDGNQLPDLLLLNKIDDEVAVYLGVATALAWTYGAGCPGGPANSIPEIFTTGDPDVPTLGNSKLRIEIAGARPASLAVLPVGTVQTGNATPCSGQLTGLFWVPFIITDTFGRGALQFPTVPNDPNLIGLRLFAQWFVLDPQGQLAANFSASPGLYLRVGR